MALLPVPKPSALIELARATVGQVVETAAAVATIPIRALSLLGQAELLVSRITVLTDDATALIGRVSVIVAEAQATAEAAGRIVTVADAISTDAGRIVVSAAAIIDSAGQLVSHASGITDGAGQLVSRASGITEGAGELVSRASGITDGAGELVSRAGGTTDAATAVVARAEAATAEVIKMLDVYAPILNKAGPLAAHFVEELSPEEVTAAIRMVDELPRLREHLTQDVMPLLGKLDQVGPDLHNLLEVTKDLHLAIAGLPGLKLLRRRGEERVAEEEESATNTRK